MLKYVFYLCALGWFATFFLMDHLPPPSAIRPELQTAPIQNPLPSAKFTLQYHGHNFIIANVATYELWGLVVSHNNPFVWYSFDISHDEHSLDTRDVCVIWGSNVRSDEYREASFHSDDWACVYRYGPGVRQIESTELSNNHLITNNAEIRERINKIQIGDQIHIRGRLVNYSEDIWNGQFRNTSTTRTDTGNGACEIIFVESLEILSSPNAIWAKLHAICLWGMAAMLIIGVIRMFR